AKSVASPARRSRNEDRGSPLSLHLYVPERSSPTRVRSAKSFQTRKRFSSAANRPRALASSGPFRKPCPREGKGGHCKAKTILSSCSAAASLRSASRTPVMLTRPRNPKIRSPPVDDVNNLRHDCKCQRRFASTAIQIRRNAVGIRNRIDEDGGPLIHNGSSNAPSTRPAAGA